MGSARSFVVDEAALLKVRSSPICEQQHKNGSAAARLQVFGQHPGTVEQVSQGVRAQNVTSKATQEQPLLWASLPPHTDRIC